MIIIYLLIVFSLRSFVLDKVMSGEREAEVLRVVEQEQGRLGVKLKWRKEGISW